MIYIEGRIAAHLPAAGGPRRVLALLDRIVPVETSRPLLIARLALAQADIVQDCPHCDTLLPGHRGWVYDIRMGARPSVEFGPAAGPAGRRRHLLGFPRPDGSEPFVDSKGYLGEAQFVRDGALARVVPPLALRTHGCLRCGLRFGSRAGWSAHACTGLPRRVRRCNWGHPAGSWVSVDFRGRHDIDHRPARIPAWMREEDRRLARLKEALRAT